MEYRWKENQLRIYNKRFVHRLPMSTQYRNLLIFPTVLGVTNLSANDKCANLLLLHGKFVGRARWIHLESGFQLVLASCNMNGTTMDSGLVHCSLYNILRSQKPETKEVEHYQLCTRQELTQTLRELSKSSKLELFAIDRFQKRAIDYSMHYQHHLFKKEDEVEFVINMV